MSLYDKEQGLPDHCKLVGGDFLTLPTKKDRLGYGGSSVVRRCYNTKLGVVAVKCMEWSFGDTQWNRNMEKRLPDEIAVSLSMNHENIIRVHGVAVWPKSLGLVLDYIPGGQLEELLGNWSIDPLPWTVRLRISYETANGLSYLHNFSKEKRIVHGDIKPENILLTSDLHAKIADFGGARYGAHTTAAHQNSTSEGATYSLLYAAPEFFRNVFGRRTTAHDVYSYGMVLYDTCARTRPYSHMNLDQSGIRNHVVSGLRPDLKPVDEEERKAKHSQIELSCFNILKRLMMNCWDNESKNRPTIDKVRDQLSEGLSKVTTSDLWRDLYRIRFQMKMQEVHKTAETSTVPLNYFYPPKFASPSGYSETERPSTQRETPRSNTSEPIKRESDKSNKNRAEQSAEKPQRKNKNMKNESGEKEAAKMSNGINSKSETNGKRETEREVKHKTSTKDDEASRHWKAGRFKEAIAGFEVAILVEEDCVERCTMKLKLGGSLCKQGDKRRGDKMILDGLQDLKSTSPELARLETIADKLKDVADDFHRLQFPGRAAIIYKTAATVYKLLPDGNRGAAGILWCVTQMNQGGNKRGRMATEHGVKFLKEILQAVKAKQTMDPHIGAELEATCNYYLARCHNEQEEWELSIKYCKIAIDKFDTYLPEKAHTKRIYALTMNTLAENKHNMGNVKEAGVLYTKTLELYKKVLDWESEDDMHEYSNETARCLLRIQKQL